MRQPSDWAQRRAAVTVFDRNVVVVAGAGTGKTALLSARALVYLLGESFARSPQHTPQQRAREVLALTFTEKAASEMAERLVAFLGILAGLGDMESLDEQVRALVLEPLLECWALSPETVRARAGSLLEYVELIDATTIHSFCASLLKRYPFEAGISPDLMVDTDGARLEELLDTVWAEHVRSQLAQGGQVPPAWSVAFDAGLTLSSLREVAGALAASNVPTEWILDPSVFVGDRDVHARRIRAALPSLAALARTIEGLGLKRSMRLARFCQALPLMARALGAHEEPHEDVEAEWCSVLKEGIDGLFPDTALRRIREAGLEEDHVRDSVARAVDLLEDARAFTPNEIAALQEICGPVVKEVRRRALDEGVVGYDHLLLYAASLLRRHPDIARALRDRYRCVLLDEVQDTDPLQYDVIKPFRADETDSPWGSCGTFVVGDPKQSIYLFRDADIQAFHEESTELATTGLPVEISANFRSDPRIIAVANALSRRLFSRGGHAADVQPPYEMLVPQLDVQGANPPVEVVRVDLCGEGVASEDRARVEHRIVATWVHRLCAEGYRWRDIAVLVPTRNGVEDLYRAMQEAGIPAVQSGGRTFYARQEVVDTVHLLACLDDPHDKGALFAFLGSPAGGVDNDDLVRLSSGGLGEQFTYLDVATSASPHDHACLQHLAGCERSRIAGVCCELARLHHCLRELPTWEAFRQIRTSLPVVEAWSHSLWGSQRMANVDKVMDEVESRVRAGASVAEVVRAMARSELVEREGEEGALASARLDAVTIETIHGAKGLEYPVVLLANLFRAHRRESWPHISLTRDWRSRALGLKVGTLCNHGARSLHLAREKKRDAERARVMYVALTRARKRLVVFLHPGLNVPSYSAMLLEALEDALNAGELADGRELSMVEGVEDSPTHVVAKDHVVPMEEALVRIERRRRAMELVAATPLRIAPSAVDEAYPRRELLGLALEEAPRTRDRALRFGDLCHAALQHLDLTRPSEDVGPFLESPLAHRVAGELYEDLVEEARTVLVAAVEAPFFRELVAQADQVVRELPMLEVVGGALLSGRIDMAVRRGTTWTVVDFKTDREIPSPEELMARYGLQKQAYTEGLRRAFGLRDAPRFYLYFLRHRTAVTL